MKKCLSCGSQLPEGARACPQCGTFVPDPGTGPDAFNLPTISSSSKIEHTESAAPYTPSQQPPSTDYGVDPYSAPPPPSYNPYSVQGGAQPYRMPSEYAPPPLQSANPFPPQVTPRPFVSPQPPLPTQSGQGKRIALIAGIIVLALILVGEGIFLLAPRNDQQGNGTSVCGFASGAYHLTGKTKGGLFCDPEAASLTLSNVVFEATITIIQGDEAGVIVRADQTKQTDYLASLTTDGSYVIVSENSTANPQNPYKTLSSGKNRAIKTGLNQANVVALAANGNTISLYINGQYVDGTTDTTYKSGQMGVYGYTANNNLDVAVSNVRVWKL